METGRRSVLYLGYTVLYGTRCGSIFSVEWRLNSILGALEAGDTESGRGAN